MYNVATQNLSSAVTS